MKYIRTEKGIYQLENNEKIVEMGVKVYIGINEFNNPTYEPIIAQADTIEELCDEFVYEYKNSFYKNSKPSYELVEMSLETMKATMEFFSGATFYGAIWTSKGLIYVAKLNDKGELELI